MRFHLRGVLPLIVILTATVSLYAQRPKLDVYPPELYSGENVVTIKLKSGISEVRATHTSNMTVEGLGGLPCRKEHELKVFLNTASEYAELNLEIIDCKHRRYTKQIKINTEWRLDRIDFNEVEEGKTTCRSFVITTSGGEGVEFDSISVADRRVAIKLPADLPIHVSINAPCRYQVCFTGDTPGEYTFPVITWMRRKYPSGGKTTYATADTGIIRVIPKKVEVDTTPPPDTVDISGFIPVVEDTITDPTTFRSVIVPNGVIPPKGTLYLGSYDLLGLTAGYSLDDHLMVIAGGAPPLPDDWAGVNGEMFGAYSIGIKVGLPVSTELKIAAGYQWGTSIYDREENPNETTRPLPDIPDSRITVNVPYVAASYGDDNNRLSLTAAYAFKHHTTLGSGEFNRNALIIAIGGDYRIAKQWKMAAEIVSMQTLDVLPVIATLRYFDHRFALDFGVAYIGITTGDAKAPSIPIVPVISGIIVL